MRIDWPKTYRLLHRVAQKIEDYFTKAIERTLYTRKVLPKSPVGYFAGKPLEIVIFCLK